MSASDPLVALTVTGRVGARIAVTDSAFRPCAEGTVSLQLRLAPGIYSISWSEGRDVSRRVIRLRAEAQTIAQPDEPDTAASDTAGAIRETAREIVSRSEDDATGRGSIVVLVASDAVKTSHLELRLFDRDEHAMRSSDHDIDAAERLASADGGVVARAYHLNPGMYRLQYKGVGGETLAQGVPCFADRRTFVLLRATVGQVLVAQGDQAATLASAGIAPQTMIAFSAPKEAPVETLAEHRRLAEILLSDLAAGGSSLGRDLLQRLQEETDPLLEVYAAGVILSRLEHDLAPSLDEEPPTNFIRMALFRRRWGQAARALLAFPDVEGLPSDVAVLRWRAETAINGVSRNVMPLRSPPILDCSWRWAMARSVADSDNIPASPSFRAAINGAVGARPWLAWKVASAKAGAAPDASVSPSTLERTLAQLNRATEQLLKFAAKTDEANPLAALSPLASSLAATSSQLAPTSLGAGLSTLFGGAPLGTELTQAFREPAAALLQRAEAALKELNAANARNARMQALSMGAAGSGGSGPPSPPLPNERPAPGLERPIRFPDDPQKGRFGEHASAGGFTLSATFPEAEGRDWVDIALRIERAEPWPDVAAAASATAQIYLHDSFTPVRHDVAFDGQAAELEVTAWGGFTVGVWIAAVEVELELDLATIPGAPQIIRDL